MSRTQNANDNRNSEGHFADGNAGGPGNPRARFAPHLRNALNECITIEMVQNVVNHIYQRALSGDMPAARLFLQYAVGKPARIDSMEESPHDNPPETELMPEESCEPAAVVEQTVRDGEPVGASPQCDDERGEQTVAKQTDTEQTVTERATNEASVETLAGEQTVALALKPRVPGVESVRANGHDGFCASPSVSPAPSAAQRVV